ncbi:MAG: ABC transporter substrate-binding protein [Lachnospiraceae bacterium]|nr:ABC transporter substrate-binding protein [Lachnospiraceae bacterium]
MKPFSVPIRRIIDTVLLLLICAACLAGCGSAACPAGHDSTAGKGTPERVIALSKSNAELWLLSGGDLIATSDDAMETEGLSADTVSLGDMDHVSLEAAVALEPDLVILFSTDPKQRALGEALEGVGVKVYYTNIDCFDDYAEVMRSFTQMTGRTDLYDRNVREVRAEIGRVLADAPAQDRERSFLLLHVSATKSKAEKSDYFACEIFEDLGLVNLATESSFDELSMEQIIAGDPDYIFVVPRGDEKKAMDSFAEIFSSQPAWQGLTAVKNGSFRLLSKDLFGLKPNQRWAESYRAAVDAVAAGDAAVIDIAVRDVAVSVDAGGCCE